MIIPWKVNFLLQQLTWSTYKKTNDVMLSPLTYYGSLVDLARNKRITAPWTFNLKTGSTVNIKHFMSSYIFREIFIDECYDEALQSITTDFPYILEIGGNTGLFALRAKTLYPKARIHSFEPEAQNYSAFKSLIQKNELEDVYVYKEAVGSESGLINLHLNDKNVGGHSTENTFAGNRIETVAMVSILDVLEEHLIFDLVKIDCEGAEYQILMTLEPKHTGQVPKIIFETINEGAKTRNLFAHLTSIGYTIRPSHNLFIAEVAGHSKRLEHIHVHSTAS